MKGGGGREGRREGGEEKKPRIKWKESKEDEEMGRKKKVERIREIRRKQPEPKPQPSLGDERSLTSRIITRDQPNRGMSK